MTIDQCEAIQEMDDSQLIGVPVTVSADVAAAKVDLATVDVQVRNAAAAVPEISTLKRRRGRPPRNQGKVAPPPPPKAMEEEDVCFICFDGGSLVLCDRRGCPKAYHPACIKRDEAFFQSKAKWNCGWHICSSCEKASHFMCYTCTYSICKGCATYADYLCVRGNKGFCGTCIKMIMLIENVPAGNSEQVQVDFDDNTSWEYLFKVYWVCLKESLLFTVDEILKATNAGQVDELPKTRIPWKVPAVMDPVSESSSELCYGRDDKATSSGNSYGSLDANHSKRRKYDVEPQVLSDETSAGTEKSSVSEAVPLPEGTKWATQELLEFVAYVRNGDTSCLSQFDVQVLLLEYIKRNNLRDPRRKFQILCDTRLINLFGKTRVGHIEMLKLLEYHFLVKEKPPHDESVRVDIAVAAAAAEGSCTDPSEGIANGSVVNNDRRRKTRKRMDEKGTHINPTPDEYAAIDIHNINLLYLKPSSMENLMIDADTFHEKVVGSFVRIRIPCGDRQQDVHRLVKVVGTDKTAQSYKLGSRTTDVMLQIMNVDKKEVVSIDGISDQDFSEEECKRLRLSVESGIVELMKVGEIQERAMALHSVKVTDFLEAEISQLNHIRDRACGNEQQKKEYLKKLEILHSAVERQRRLNEVPFVHSDPNMGPHCKSEGNIKDVNDHIKSNPEGLGSSSHGQNSQATAPSEPIPAVSSVMPFPPTTELISCNDDELQRLWHYRDPFGAVQGPFPMMQLRNWSTSGLFPLDLRVWMMNGKEKESVLLTDALLRLFHKEIITDRSDKNCQWNRASSQDTATTHMHENIVHQNGQPEKKDSSSMDAGNGEITGSKELGSRSSRLTMLLDLVIGSNEPAQNSELLCDLSKNSTSGGSESQICDSVVSPSTSAKVCDVEMLFVTPVDGEENKSTSVNDVKRSPHKTNPKEKTVVEDGDENKVKNEGCSSQSSGQSWHPTHMNISYGWDLNSTFPSMVNSNGAVKNEQEVSFFVVGSSLLKHDDVDSKGQSGEQKYSVSCNASITDAGPSWSTTSSLVGGARLPDVAAEWTGYSSVPAKPSVEDWGSNLVSASSSRLPDGSSGHAAIPTSEAGELSHTSLSPASIDTTGWQAMVSEPNEFSLVDESVSDLLAEVEAMESLGGFPSPTSKLSRVGDFMHVSDNDCFSPVENFSTAPAHGRSDALSSAGDIQMPSRLSLAEEQLGLSIMSSQPIVPRDSLEKTQKPPQLTVTEPFHISLMLPQSGTGPTPPRLLQAEPIGNVCTDVREANWWEGSSERQAHQSSSRQANLDLDNQLPPGSNVSCQVEGRSDVQFPAPASVDLRLGNSRGRSILGIAPGIAAQGNTSTHSGTRHGSIKKQSTQRSSTSTGHSTTSTGNPILLGSQPKHGNDKHFGSRDHRSQHQSSRDSGHGRERSVWNGYNRHAPHGGGSLRSPPKGQRVCKFYESGCCKKGPSCTFWHPS